MMCTCSLVKVVLTLVMERDMVTMEELVSSCSRLVRKLVTATRYSSPVSVTLPVWERDHDGDYIILPTRGASAHCSTQESCDLGVY